jgi:putative transposase
VHEDLRITNMVRSGSGTVDQPGTNVAAKRGLNRSIHDAGWGQLVAFIAYKAEEAGRHVIAVNPRHTSQRCAECGHIAKDNRVSQAAFRCQACGHSGHADVNAAVNILRAGLAQRRAPAERGARGRVA